MSDGKHAYLLFNSPTVSAEGNPPVLAEVFNMSAACNKENNPYSVAAHVLARLHKLSGSESAGIHMVSFMNRSQSLCRNLWLCCYWRYGMCGLAGCRDISTNRLE